MPYLTAYSINYKNFDPQDKTEQDVGVNLYDSSTFTSEPIDQSYIALTPDDNPIQLSFLDTDENIFTAIRGRRAALSFLSSLALDFNTFATGADDNWIAEVGVGSTFIFKGYLVLDGLGMRFMPNPQSVSLDMTDGLATLSDIPLTNDDETNVSGYYSLIEYVALCLKKTGKSMPIHIVQSIAYGSGVLVNDALFSAAGQYIVTIGLLTNFFYPGQRFTVTGSVFNNTTFTVDYVVQNVVTEVHVVETITTGETATVTFTDTVTGRLFDNNFLEAKTFEKDIGVSEDCRTVLDKIFSAFGMFVCQHNSEWWAYAIDDFRHTQYISDNYTFDGVYVDSTTTSSDKVLSFLADGGTDVSLRRPAKSTTIEYRYEYPREIPCNVDFSRGDLIDGTSQSEKTYELDCWTLLRGIAASSTAPNTTAYIQREFNSNDSEVARYVVIESPASSTSPINYIQNEAVPVEEKDKFSFSVDYAWASDASSGANYTQQVFSIRLEGYDGSHWTVDEAGKWFLSDVDWTMNFKVHTEVWVPDDIDETDFRTKSVDVEPVPVSGDIYFMLFALNQQATGLDDVAIHFNNLSFEYIPFINGSYHKFTGHQHIFTQSGGFKPAVLKQVFIAEGIKRLFKGALHYYTGTDYILSIAFHNSRDGSGNGLTVTTHGKLLANAYWNQYRDHMRKFDLVLRGLQTDTEDVPGLINRYLIGVNNESTTNRKFVAVAMSQNLRDCSWTAIMWEVYSIIRGYEWDETKYSFKYLT